jgi:hypothetical protein
MRRKLGEILVTAGFVTNEDIQLALTDQSAGEPARLGDLLVALGKITPLQLARALSTQYAIPYLDLPVVPPEVMGVVPLDFQTQYRFLPIKVEQGVLTIAMADLSQLVTDVLPTLKRQFPSVKVFVAAGDEIDAVHAALSGQYATAPAASLPAIAPAIAPVAAVDLFASFELDPPPPGPSLDELDVDVSASGLIAAPRAAPVEEEEPSFFEASLSPLAPSSPSPAPPSIAPVIAPVIPSIAPVTARPATGKLSPAPRPPTGKLPPPPPPAVRAVTVPPPPPISSSPSFPDLMVEVTPAAPPTVEVSPSAVMISPSAITYSPSSITVSPSAVFEFDAPPPLPASALAESVVDDFFAPPAGAPAPPPPADSFDVSEVVEEPPSGAQTFEHQFGLAGEAPTAPAAEAFELPAAPLESFEVSDVLEEPPGSFGAGGESFELPEGGEGRSAAAALALEPFEAAGVGEQSPAGFAAGGESFELPDAAAPALEPYEVPEQGPEAFAAGGEPFELPEAVDGATAPSLEPFDVPGVVDEPASSFSLPEGGEDSFDASALDGEVLEGEVAELSPEPEEDLPFFESSSPSQAVALVVDDAFVPGVPTSSPSSLAQLMIEPEAPVAPIIAPMMELPRIAPVVAPVPPPPAVRSSLVPPPPPAPSVPSGVFVEATVEAAPSAELPDWLKGSNTQEVTEVGWTGALDHLAPSKLILAVTRALIRRGVVSERDILDAVDKKK